MVRNSVKKYAIEMAEFTVGQIKHSYFYCKINSYIRATHNLRGMLESLKLRGPWPLAFHFPAY